MQIPAKNIKTGDIVKYCNVWVLAKKVEHTTFKNGKAKVEVNGTQLEGRVRHRGTHRSSRVPRIENYNVSFAAETKVQIR